MKFPDFQNPIYNQILEFKPRKSDMRKVTILESVLDCIANDGIDNTTAQLVGKKAKMRRSHVAYYFPDRDAMIEAALKFVVSTGQEITVAYLTPATNPRDSLIRYVEGTFAWLERHPRHASVVILLHYYGVCIPKYRKFHSQIRRTSESRIEAILQDAPAKKGLGKAQTKRVSRTIRSILVGSLVVYFSTEREQEYDVLRKETIEAICAVADTYWK
jgi:AcrR family transcriptional regulator